MPLEPRSPLTPWDAYPKSRDAFTTYDGGIARRPVRRHYESGPHDQERHADDRSTDRPGHKNYACETKQHDLQGTTVTHHDTVRIGSRHVHMLLSAPTSPA